MASTRELFSDLRTAVSVSFSAAMAAVLPQDPRKVENRVAALASVLVKSLAAGRAMILSRIPVVVLSPSHHSAQVGWPQPPVAAVP